MENSDEGSDSEHGAIGNEKRLFHQGGDGDGYPSNINILKPQIDKIFSEVQKNLPTIDFDSSDISSDNDEPIFFHQNLKLSEFASVFDDDKDLDTSLSQGDFPEPSGSIPRTDTNFGNKNFTANLNDPAEDDLSLYDNDLAALLGESTFPSEDDIVRWQSMARKMDEDEEALETREEADLLRSQKLGHFKNSSTSTETQQTQSHRSVDTSDCTENGALRQRYNSQQQHSEIDPTDISIELDSDKGNVDNTRTLPPFVKSFTERLERGLKILDPSERRRKLAEKARCKDEEIVSKFTPQEPTTLNLRLFEELDLDSVLNAANEENVPVTSLRVMGRPTASQIPKHYDGSGDQASDKGSEELTLMQKLAQLSLAQSGTDPKSVKSVDPYTGTVVTTTDSRLIVNQEEVTSSAGATTSIVVSPEDHQAAGSKSSDSGSQTLAHTTSAGTNTAAHVEKAKILYGRLRHEKKETEPPTIFIDLRGFERKKEEEKQGLESVQRVLGIGATQSDDDSSSDDEEMVERCNWRQTRQKIKEDLTVHGAAGVSQPDQKDKESASTPARPKYPTPPRVINLQEHAVSKKWTSTQTVVLPGERTDTVGEEEEDNKLRMEKLEAEREKEKQREEARRLREEREKERERRMRMSKHIEAARSQATTQGRQIAGESTPIVFDIEVSYEPAPTTLPTILTAERETLLLTIHLSSNVEIVQHRNRSNRSVDAGEGLSATYAALLSWLLSLVPEDFSFLQSQSSASDQPSSRGPTFHVVGLQQMWFEEELRLCVVVTPSETFEAEVGKHSRSKKGKQKDEMKGSSKFAQHMTKLLSVNTLYTVCPWVNTLVSVEVQSERPEDKNAPPYSYSPPLPKISTKPLSTFIQVNPDPQAARKILNIPVGFYWQTVDNDENLCDIECHDTDVNYETQNTMSLIYKKIFHNPLSLMAILNRVSQEGLDLAGVRLLYPCPDLLKTQNSEIPPSSDLDLLNNVGPVLALALRGTFARTIWLDSVGPADPQLARRTDPNSLCALFGGESRDNVLLFCPRNPSRVQSELTRWFGGRIPKNVSSVDVGVPYMKKEEGRGKKGKRATSSPDPKFGQLSTHRPPAALTATSKADIFLVLSPLVPTSYMGVLMAAAQRRGYQIRGVRRLCMTAKIAGNLGINTSMQPCFCPGARMEEMCTDTPLEAIAPSTVFLLWKENAAHNTHSLIEAFMVQLTLAGLLGCVQMRVDEKLTSKHLFHGSTYTDGLLAVLGGHFTKCPEFDISHLRMSSAISSSISKDLEQMALIILLGHDMLKKCGVFVGKILNILPYSKTPVQPVLTERFELLGLKWIPSLSMHQAKELTPYEVGDKRWKQSVRLLASEPALVLALRGVNIFNLLKPVIDQQQLQQQQSLETSARMSQMWGTTTSTSATKEKRIECMMSHNPSESDMFARLFFHHHELYPDPLARSLLPFLPESRMYFNLVERQEQGDRVRIFSLKPEAELNLTQENIMEEMVAGQQPVTTLMLIKPGAVQKYLQRILKKVVQEHFRIVGLRLLMLNAETADLFIPASQRKDNTTRQQHIEAMTFGPSMALALQHQNAVKRLCDLVGPEEPMSARRQSQFLWRGEFGRDIIHNGLYCSGTYIDGVRDLKLLFPDGLGCENCDLLTVEEIPAPASDSTVDVSASTNRQVTVTEQRHQDGVPHELTIKDVHSLLLQTTCVILTPPLMKMSARAKDVAGLDLVAMFVNNGFELVASRLVWLTQKQSECLLRILGDGSFQQVKFLSAGPSLILAMQRDNAVLAFESILNQHGECIRLMQEHGKLILRPHNIKQSHSLLGFFFDRLMPGSQVTITDKLNDQAGEGDGAVNSQQ